MARSKNINAKKMAKTIESNLKKDSFEPTSNVGKKGKKSKTIRGILDSISYYKFL